MARSDREATVPTGHAPTAKRRTVLKLLAGSIAGAGLSGRGAGFAVAAEPPAPVGDTVIEPGVRFRAAQPRCRAARQRLRAAHGFRASETLRLADGKRIDRFAVPRPAQRRRGRRSRRAARATSLRGRAGEGIEKEISIVLYDRYPGFALMRVAYRNVGADAIRIEGWVNGAHVLKPAADGALRLLVVLRRLLRGSPRLGAAAASRISISATSWA